MRATDSILDFNGNVYEHKEEKKDCFHKMSLVQMSQNNQYFIFQNRELNKMFIYELIEMKTKKKEGPITARKKTLPKPTVRYNEFVMR